MTAPLPEGGLRQLPHTVDSRNSVSAHLHPSATQAYPVSLAGTEASRSTASLTAAVEAREAITRRRRERNYILAVPVADWL